MCYSPISSPSYSRTYNNFYLTSLHPPSYYSYKNSLNSPKNNRTYFINSSPNTLNSDYNYNLENSADNFRKSINRLRSSPFYNNEKSLRIQNEIDWINKIVTRKPNINKNVEVETSTYNNNCIKDEEKDINNLLRSKIRVEQLNNINNEINRLMYKKLNYADYLIGCKDDTYPLIITTKYKKNGIFSKNDVDDYNHKVFMNEMINFKQNGINKWKKDFQSKFNEY